MTGQTLTLRHLCFTGPNRTPASVKFGPGLNVIYGASDTGKSIVLETIDFMLGSSEPLRDIPERIGYDRIFLGIEVSDGSTFTLERATSGGKFSCHAGLHEKAPPSAAAVVLSAKHSATKANNVSTFLLEKIGLAGKRVRKNASGATNSLSFRNLAAFFVVSEGDIQKQGSPIETGQFLTKTSEMSTFKLLLTGVDDSAIQAEERSPDEKLSSSAKIEVINELIANYRERLISLVGDDIDSLDSQAVEIDGDLSRERALLDQKEQIYRALTQKRSELRRVLQESQQRRIEIDEMLARFLLLDEHYGSDLARLEALREAGSLVSALGPESCPLCGAAPEAQHRGGDCDGNIDVIIAAADAETAKILRLREELRETMEEVRTEARRVDESTPSFTDQLSTTDTEIQRISPAASEQRSAYSDLIEKRSVVQQALSFLSTIADLEERKSAVGGTVSDKDGGSDIQFDLSTATLDAFSKQFESILTKWNFPDANRVYFDKDTRDFVIAGKPRGSRGKGMRAITHAAFSVALLEFTQQTNMPHAGFVVMDTPLLAYREPEGDEDDLSGTDVQDRFYEHLATEVQRQVIVLENVDPPASIRDREQTIFFSKNPHKDRYGLFPL